MYVYDLHTTFQTPSADDLLVIAMKLKAKENFAQSPCYCFISHKIITLNKYAYVYSILRHNVYYHI
jgi:hypothetical protein